MIWGAHPYFWRHPYQYLSRCYPAFFNVWCSMIWRWSHFFVPCCTRSFPSHQNIFWQALKTIYCSQSYQGTRSAKKKHSLKNHTKKTKGHLVGGFNHPVQKYARQVRSFPQFGGVKIFEKEWVATTKRVTFHLLKDGSVFEVTFKSPQHKLRQIRSYLCQQIDPLQTFLRAWRMVTPSTLDVGQVKGGTQPGKLPSLKLTIRPWK